MEDSIISEFNTYGKHLFVVKVSENVHVMDAQEIKQMYGSWHPERWNKRESA